MSESTGSGYDPLAASLNGLPVFDVVSALLQNGEREGVHLLRLSEQVAVLETKNQRSILVFRLPLPGAEIPELLEEILERNSRYGTEVIFVGGPPSQGAVIESALPKLLMNPLLVFHLADGGAIARFPGGGSKSGGRLSSLSQVRRLSANEREELKRKGEHDKQSRAVDQKERARFLRRMQGRQPRATYALLGAIVVMFLLQSLWQPSPRYMDELYVRMGALEASLIEQGQWFRMVSVGFLHGGLVHLAMNGFVLFVLGTQMEKVLGSARFLILYTVALLGASFASMQFGSGFSVGASGAIWGLLGGQVSLAYRRPPLLPRSMAESIRPLVKQNILLNLGLSLLPFIDAAAHLGGGIVGLGVLASGVLYPRMSEDATQKEQEDSPQVSFWLGVVAIGCVCLLALGVAQALLWGRPWEMQR